MEKRTETTRGAPAPAELPAGQQARRDRIVAAAIELLRDDDYDGIHMRLVAERAGVALGTLYRYFPSKERLFAAALVQWGQSFQQRYERTIRSDVAPPAQRLKQTLHAAVGAFERNPRFFGLVAALQSSDDPEVAGLFGEFSGTTVGVVRDAVEGVDERWLEPIETLSLAVLFSQLRGWSIGSLSMSEVRQRLDECVELIFTDPRATDGT